MSRRYASRRFDHAPARLDASDNSSGVAVLGLCLHDPLVEDALLAETVVLCWTEASGLFCLVLSGPPWKLCEETDLRALERDPQRVTVRELVEMMLEEFPPPPFDDDWWSAEGNQVREMVARLREAQARAPLTYSRVLLVAATVREESEHSAILKVVME